jgi:hypothetical protein
MYWWRSSCSRGHLSAELSAAESGAHTAPSRRFLHKLDEKIWKNVRSSQDISEGSKYKKRSR